MRNRLAYHCEMQEHDLALEESTSAPSKKQLFCQTGKSP